MVGGGGEDDEAGPVVFYQFAHCEEVGGGGSTVIEGRVEVRALSVVAGRREWAVGFLCLVEVFNSPCCGVLCCKACMGPMTGGRWV